MTFTLLTLVVIPVIFTYVDRFQTHLLRRFKAFSPNQGTGEDSSELNGSPGKSSANPRQERTQFPASK